jgi:hypothetical protein
LVGRLFKKNLIPEIIIGFAVGVSWEMVTAPLWIYNTNMLTAFYIEGQEIPIEVVLLWASTLSFLSLTIGLMYEKIFEKTRKLTFLSSLILFLVVGWLIEYIGTQYGFWSYSWDNKVNIFSVPVVVLYGWVFESTLYVSTIQLYRKDIENLIRIW